MLLQFVVAAATIDYDGCASDDGSFCCELDIGAGQWWHKLLLLSSAATALATTATTTNADGDDNLERCVGGVDPQGAAVLDNIKLVTIQKDS